MTGQRDVDDILRNCQMSARGFFYSILPMLEKGRPYGHLEMDTNQLAMSFHISLHMIRRYIYELKKHQVIKENSDGTFYCPILIRRCMKISFQK